MKRSLSATVWVVAMWLGGHEFKSWNQPLASAMQGCPQYICNGSDPSLDPTIARAFIPFDYHFFQGTWDEVLELYLPGGESGSVPLE